MPPRTIVVVIPNSSSWRKHFWHFTMGEMFPAIWHALNGGYSRLMVRRNDRDWGKCPLDRFYSDISSELLEISLVNIDKDDYPVYTLCKSDAWDRWRPGTSPHGISRNFRTRQKIRTVISFLKDVCIEYCKAEGLTSET